MTLKFIYYTTKLKKIKTHAVKLNANVLSKTFFEITENFQIN
jgi:hypothetical protein